MLVGAYMQQQADCKGNRFARVGQKQRFLVWGDANKYSIITAPAALQASISTHEWVHIEACTGAGDADML